MGVMGRPRKELDFKIVEAFCRSFSTGQEIADSFGISYDTLLARIKEQQKPDGSYYESFSEFFKEKSALGRTSLRAKQYKVAMTGNVGMLKWLGANYLDQTDKSQVETIGDTKIYIDIVDDDARD